MTKKKSKPKTKPASKALTASTGSQIPAAKLLRAEAARLDVLKHSMPDKAQQLITAQIWAFEMSAAFLDSLGAPERIQGYIPANDKSTNAEGNGK